MWDRSGTGTKGEDAMFEFEAVRAVLSFDTYLLGIHEPAFPIDVFDAVACYETPYTFGQAVNDALLPRLHFGPIKRDGFSRDAHGGEIFLVRLLIAFR